MGVPFDSPLEASLISELAARVVDSGATDPDSLNKIKLEFCREHDLKMVTVADLIRYRMQHERYVRRMAEAVLPTRYGDFRMIAYSCDVDHDQHVALIRGELAGTTPPLVRVHVRDTLRDLIGIHALELGWPLHAALKRVAAEDHGVIVILQFSESPRELLDAARALGEPRAHRSEVPVLRSHGIGAQILQDLGVTRMRVLSAPKQLLGLAAFGLEVTEYVDENVATEDLVRGARA